MATHNFRRRQTHVVVLLLFTFGFAFAFALLSSASKRLSSSSAHEPEVDLEKLLKTPQEQVRFSLLSEDGQNSGE